MSLVTLRTLVREDILDDTPDADTPTDADYSWPASFLDRYLNEAQREACRRDKGDKLIFDDTTEAVCRITLVDGTAGYALSSKILSVSKVLLDGSELPKTTEQELEDEFPGWRTDKGTPERFYIKGRKLYCYPTPDAVADGEILTIEVYRLPLVDMSDDADEPEIPEEYHDSLVYWAAYRAWMRRDEDTFDPNKAAEMKALFAEVFGNPVSVDAREHKLESAGHISFRFERGYSDQRQNTNQEW